jgi:hypothetical protein
MGGDMPKNNELATENSHIGDSSWHLPLKLMYNSIGSSVQQKEKFHTL